MTLSPEFLELLAVLEKAQEQRGTDLSWIVYERRMMFQAVNRMRRERGKAALPASEVERVEKNAVGHSDYTEKFARYCAELVEK